MVHFLKRYHPPGTAPGTLQFDEPDSAGSRGDFQLLLTDYTTDELIEKELDSAQDCLPFLDRESRTWIQVNGKPTPEMLRSLGNQFGLHELALEDVVSSGQRPKVERYGDQLFVVLALPIYDEGKVDVAQISLFVGENYVIGFCPIKEDIFQSIRKRMRPPNNARFRSHEVDYLVYAIADLVIDKGFPVLEAFGDEIESLEEDLLAHPGNQTLAWIHQMKRELLLLRRMLWPHREVINYLLREEESLIRENTHVYLRDCYDHSIQIMDLLENFRDMVTGMLDVYLSSISNRTNEIMRVLTVIATIFIPLTFIVGVYGMNFSNDKSPWAMPELHWYYGYPLCWLLMLGITAGLLWYFRRHKWI